jgi:hypothetical protein
MKLPSWRRLWAGYARPLVAPGSPVRRGALLAAPGVLLAVLFLVAGLRGLNYGYHWDEADGQIQPVRQMVANGVLVPRMRPYSYNYPGLSRWMVLWPSLPAALRTAVRTGFEPTSIQKAMLEAIDAPTYLFTLRCLFLSVSSLAVLFTYFAALAWRLPWWAATVAATGLGLSWEFGYHARFVATDCVVTVFSALTLLAVGLYARAGALRYLFLAALGVGFAMGTKYTGVFLLLPVLLVDVLLTRPRHRILSHAARAFAVLALAGFVFLLTTPGAVLDPFTFLTDLRFIKTYYSTSVHGGYTVASTRDHARIIAQFLALSFFSPHRLLALVKFSAIVVGVVLWLRRDWRGGLVLLVFPVAFLCDFAANYRLVTVRNYLFVTPFLALFLGRTALALGALAGTKPRRWALAGLLVGVSLPDAVFVIAAGESIRHASPALAVRQAFEYAAARPDVRFRASEKVLASAKQHRVPIPRNVRAQGRADKVLFWGKDDVPDPWRHRTNDPNLYDAVFGPREVNLFWYSTWSGKDHVVTTSLANAQSLAIAVAAAPPVTSAKK